MKEKIFETTQLINTNTHTHRYTNTKHWLNWFRNESYRYFWYVRCVCLLLFLPLYEAATILTHYSMFTFRLRARIFLPYAISKKCKTKSEQTMIELSFSTVSCNKQHEQRPFLESADECISGHAWDIDHVTLMGLAIGAIVVEVSTEI